MRGFKAAFRYFYASVQDEWRNVSTYVFIGVVFLTVQFLFSGTTAYLHEKGYYMNLWELYIWFMGSRETQVIYLLGVIFLAGRVMNFHQETSYYLLRMDRNSWVLSRIIYLLFSVAVWNIFLLVCFWIACGGMITGSGKWSRAAVFAAQRSVEAIGMRGVVYAPFGLLQSNPNFVGVVALILSLLTGMFTGLIMMLCYLKKKPVYGAAMIFILWFVDFLIEGESYLQLLEYVSPYGLSRVSRLSLNYGIPMWYYAVLFLLCLVLILAQMSVKFTEEIDFIKLE